MRIKHREKRIRQNLLLRKTNPDPTIKEKTNQILEKKKIIRIQPPWKKKPGSWPDRTKLIW